MFGEMFSSDNYHKVLMAFEEGKSTLKSLKMQESQKELCL